MADRHDAMIDCRQGASTPFGTSARDPSSAMSADAGLAEEAEIPAFERKLLVKFVNGIAIVRASGPKVDRRSVSQDDVGVVLHGDERFFHSQVPSTPARVRRPARAAPAISSVQR